MDCGQIKSIFLITSLIFVLPCFAQTDTLVNSQIEYLNSEIISLKTTNDSLSRSILKYEYAKDSYLNTVDKIDALYNNAFDRFMVFWGIIGAIITIGIPYYITRIQKKTIELKKEEIVRNSTGAINQLEETFLNNLRDKYQELNELIRDSNQENKENLKKDSQKSLANNFYIVSKINELDEKYDLVLNNLLSGLKLCINGQWFSQVNMFSKRILEYINKFKNKKVEISEATLNSIYVYVNDISITEEMDTDVIQSIKSEIYEYPYKK